MRRVEPCAVRAIGRRVFGVGAAADYADPRNARLRRLGSRFPEISIDGSRYRLKPLGGIRPGIAKTSVKRGARRRIHRRPYRRRRGGKPFRPDFGNTPSMGPPALRKHWAVIASLATAVKKFVPRYSAIGSPISGVSGSADVSRRTAAAQACGS